MRPAQLAGLVSAGVPLSALDMQVDIASQRLLRLAVSVGAPMLPALNALEQQLFARERIAAEVFDAQAVPKATRKLLLWLPIASVALGELMGLRTISGLVTPIGIACFVLALLILWAGSKVSGKMLARLENPKLDSSEELLAIDICLAAGVQLGQIQDLIGTDLSPKSRELMDQALDTGAHLRALIAAEVQSLNQQELTNRLGQAKRLSVSLLIPLSLSTLPAFLLLTIPPMLIGITK